MFSFLFATAFILLASNAHAQHTVTASWDRNSDDYTAGYRVYYGTSSGDYQWSVDAGNDTRVPLNLSPGRYFFVVRGYTSSYRLGPSSSEVSLSVGSTTTPTAPTATLSATLQGSNTASLRWQTTNATSATLNGVSVPVSGSTSVTINTSTTFTLVARNASGVTASDSVRVTLSGGEADDVPLAPIDLNASVSGRRVTLTWRPDTAGGTPTDYVIYAGTYSWGSDLIDGESLGNVTRVIEDMPYGTYYVRLRARNAYGISRSSEQLTIRVGSSLASPTGFSADWAGTTATLNWIASAADSAETVPSNYVLEAGTGPGLANVAAIPVAATTFSVNITRGVYYARVRAVNAHGDSVPTRELIIAAPGSAAAPTSLVAGGSGNQVEFSWTPPAASGEAPSGYVLEAGSAPGMADVASVNVGNVTHFATTAPSGRYYVRVRAVNSLGAGLHSNEVVIER